MVQSYCQHKEPIMWGKEKIGDEVWVQNVLHNHLVCIWLSEGIYLKKKIWGWFYEKELKSKHQYFGHLMQRDNSWKRPWCWERLRAGWEGGDRGWDSQMASLTQWTWAWADSGKRVKDREAWHVAVHGVGKSLTWLSDQTTTKEVSDTSNAESECITRSYREKNQENVAS